MNVKRKDGRFVSAAIEISFSLPVECRGIQERCRSIYPASFLFLRQEIIRHPGPDSRLAALWSLTVAGTASGGPAVPTQSTVKRYTVLLS